MNTPTVNARSVNPPSVNPPSVNARSVIGSSVRAATPSLLVAAVFLVTAELLRAASPLLDLAAGGIGVIGAAGLAMVIFVAPALIGVAVAAAGTTRAMLGAVAAVVALRLAAQLQDPPSLLVVGTGAAAGIGGLVLTVRHAAVTRSAVAATTGVLLGMVADLTIRAAYATWDPIFRPGVLPWLVTLVVGAVAVAAVLAARRSPAATAGGGRLGVLGPHLALYVLAYGSAGFAASQAGVPLPLAAAVLIATAIAALVLIRRTRLPGGGGAAGDVAAADRWSGRWLAGHAAIPAVAGGLIAGVAAAYFLTGPIVLAALPVAGLSAAVLLTRALGARAGASGRPPAVGYTVAALAAGLGYVLPVMIFQIHYDLEFPFDNRFVLVAAAAVLGLAGLGTAGVSAAGTGRRPAARGSGRRRLLTGPAAVAVVVVVALLVPLAMAVTRPAVPAADHTGAAVRLMSWNVMYGRDHTGGAVDPESVAVAIERAAPDVVLLQEVSRGWPIGGGVDMAEWLSRRLEMAYEWAPAADGQFGNLLLTRLRVSDVAAVRLPFVQGPMERSYLAATLHVDGDRKLHLFNAHLQHRMENTRTRLVQSEALLAAWDGEPHTVIAGDFNFWPSWQEPRRFAAAGFDSAQDITGHGAEFTVPSDDPDNRVDWIFGTPDLTFSEFEILDGVTNSDHFPLLVTVELG